MANYSTQFSTLFPLASDADVAPALVLYEQLAAELEAAGETIGFEAEDGGLAPEAPRLWLYSNDSGEPEHVIAFALRCAEAFGLTGHWGFVWGLGCSRPQVDGFGVGAHLLDLSRRETVAWVDCGTWLAEQLAARETAPARAETLVRDAAAREGWTAATEAGVLLGFIDALIADDPSVAERLQAHLAAASAEPETMLCRKCGELMFIAAEGTSHHTGDTMDGIGHARDRDHVALPDEEG